MESLWIEYKNAITNWINNKLEINLKLKNWPKEPINLIKFNLIMLEKEKEKKKRKKKKKIT